MKIAAKIFINSSTKTVSMARVLDYRDWPPWRDGDEESMNAGWEGVYKSMNVSVNYEEL